MSPGRGGIVAVSHPLAAEAGAALLRQGGNALDAAAAIQLALGVVEPHASGLGGGAFSLIHLANGDRFALDSRESAPAGATPDQFLGPDGAPLPFPECCASGLAVGVPGTLLGLTEALDRWGSRSLDDVVRPAVELAEGGVPVSAFLAARLEQHAVKLARDPAAAALFLPGGRALQAGERLVQPELGRALRLIGQSGPGAFYERGIGRALVAAVQARGGRISAEDLARYRVRWRRPLLGSYRGRPIATMPPPGAGVSLLQMLALLETFDLAGFGHLSPARAHLELQAMRLGLVDRTAHLGDPDYTAVPIERLLDPAYLAARRAQIRAGALGPAPAPGLPSCGPLPARGAAPEIGQTTHFVVADRWGNVVSCTSTLEEFFGSGITVPGYGILLNNELTDFDPSPGGANQVRPLARPASSMVPTMILEGGRPRLALGSPGGPTIVTVVLQVLLRILDDRLDPQAAVNAPRLFAGRYPRVTWEQGLPPETLVGLTALGHQPAEQPTTIGSVQLLMIDPDSGEWSGAADPRRDGTVITVD